MLNCNQILFRNVPLFILVKCVLLYSKFSVFEFPQSLICQTLQSSSSGSQHLVLGNSQNGTKHNLVTHLVPLMIVSHRVLRPQRECPQSTCWEPLINLDYISICFELIILCLYLTKYIFFCRGRQFRTNVRIK